MTARAQMEKKNLGITGGIGSGKSTVGQLLADYCQVPFINVDQCCRHLLDINAPGWIALRENLAPSFFLPDGHLDRVALREGIFADAALRQQVDALLHPLAKQAAFYEASQQDSWMVIMEVPLLYEAGWQDAMDAVIVAYARPDVRCLRIMQRDGVSRQQALRAIKAQMPLEEKKQRADYVIDTSGSMEETRQATFALGLRLSNEFFLFRSGKNT